MRNTQKILFELIRGEICTGSVDPTLRDFITAEMLPSLYSLSKAHDVAHITGQALASLAIKIPDELDQKFEKAQMLAFYRYRNTQFELDQICKALNDAKIPHMPLKGSVIRNYYPNPWMRTSCDIDMLVHEEDLDRAVAALTEALGYTCEGREYHDVSLYSKTRVHVELHFMLAEEKNLTAAYKLLEHAWEHATPISPHSYRYEMSDAMFYFYHISHMAAHFFGGGCGIRPFLDLWILEHIVKGDRASRDQLLQKGELLTFADSARTLSEVWFSGTEHTALSLRLEQYVLGGGMYGSTQNKAAAQQAKRGGKGKFILSRIFLPYRQLKTHYPILKRHKWLFPFLQIARWFRLLSPKRSRHAINEIQASNRIKKETVDATAELFSKIGLS